MTSPAYSVGALPRDRRVAVEATDGRRVVARIRGRFPAPTLFVLDAVECDPDADAEAVHHALATRLASAFLADGGEALVIETPEREAWRRALERAGFEVARRKAFVARSLAEGLPPAPDGLRSISLADAGEAAFVARMGASSAGDPFEERKGTDQDPVREWRDLVSLAGERFDASKWLLVDDDRGPVGVVLPQSVNATTGTLYYLGVLPARRGAGFGTALHALGLHRLAESGLAGYVGSTDVRNAPMRRVFARNGCREEGTEAYFLLAPAVGR